MKCPALFFLVAIVVSGCVNDCQNDGAEALYYRKLFEAGRRAERKGDVKIAQDTYTWLAGHECCCGEYGLAMLLLGSEPGSQEAVGHLLSCAKRSSCSSWSADPVMNSAFSAAAMAELAGIAISRLDRPDVAASLYCMMSDIITPQVYAWTEEMMADADSATIYSDIISVVEANRHNREYAKVLKWSEICEAFLAKGVTE